VNVYLETFGCRANRADSEAVRALVLGAGYQLVTSAADADVALFNSCTVTAAADADVRHAIRRAPTPRKIVMGCLPASRAVPGVSETIDGADLDALAVALGIPVSSAKRQTVRQTGTRALLRIQDGCDEHCTFCATTIARGAHRSREIADVVAEAERLAEWHPEIVLTGIHIGSCESLGRLVEALVERLPDTRFRLSSIEATEVDSLLRGLLRRGAVAPWLHAPLQSGSDRVLKRMGRHWYTATTYERAIAEIVDGLPVFGLGADVIAGFPGETDADHRATMALVDRLPFTALHVFPYSPRPGTAAERLGPPVRASERAAELRALAARKAAAYREARQGTMADAIAMGSRSAMTEDYLTVELADPTIPRGTRWRGMLVGSATAPDRLTITR
jgi:threonylcarbamoyladenosine tRNA methylthiotransferase MtaB